MVHPPSSFSSLYRHQFLSRDTVSKYSPDGENSICVKKVWSKSAIILSKMYKMQYVLFWVKEGTKFAKIMDLYGQTWTQEVLRTFWILVNLVPLGDFSKPKDISVRM